MTSAKLVALVVFLLPACLSNILNFTPTIITHLRQLPKCPRKTDDSRATMRSVFTLPTTSSARKSQKVKKWPISSTITLLV
ncbi:hypothetical protein COOONC_16188 [Cooperia oncophora]